MQTEVKHKVVHEANEFLWAFLLLALFFSTLATYTMLLLDEYHVRYIAFGSALLQAVVLAKVIVIGQKARLGRKLEHRPILVSALYKACLFALLAAAIHTLEELAKQKLHGLPISFHGLRLDQILGRNLVVLWVFIPFFMFMELRRALGEEKFKALFKGQGSRSTQIAPEERRGAGASKH